MLLNSRGPSHHGLLRLCGPWRPGVAAQPRTRACGCRAHHIIFRRIHGHRVDSSGKIRRKKCCILTIFPNRRKTSKNTKLQINTGTSSGLFKAPYHRSFSEHLHYRKKVSNSGEVDVGPRLISEPFRSPPQTGSQGLDDDGRNFRIFRNNFPASTQMTIISDAMMMIARGGMRT